MDTSTKRNQFVTKVTRRLATNCAPLPRELLATANPPARFFWAVDRLVSVEERDRRIPFDGVPDRRGKLIGALVGQHLRVRAAAMIDADDGSLGD